MSASDALSGQQFFHASGARLKRGATLKTFHELHGEDAEDGLYVGDHAWRAQRVWMAGSVEGAEHWAHPTAAIYQVKPSSDVVAHTHDEEFGDGTAHQQYHASSAKVVRRVR